MFFHFVKYKLDTIKLKTKLFAGSKRGGDSFCCLFAGFSRITNFLSP